MRTLILSYIDKHFKEGYIHVRMVNKEPFGSKYQLNFTPELSPQDLTEVSKITEGLLAYYQQYGVIGNVKRMEIYGVNPKGVNPWLVHYVPEPVTDRDRRAFLVGLPTNDIHGRLIRAEIKAESGLVRIPGVNIGRWWIVNTVFGVPPHPEGRQRILGPNPRVIATIDKLQA